MAAAGFVGPLTTRGQFATVGAASIRRPGLLAGERRLLLFIADCAVVCGSLYAATARDAGRSWPAFVVMLGLWGIMAMVFDCYEIRQMSRLGRSIPSAYRAQAGALVAYLALAYLDVPNTAMPLEPSLLAIAPWSISALFGLAAVRFGYERLLTSDGLQRKLVIVGADDSARTIVDLVRTEARRDYQVVGVISAAQKTGEARGDLPLLGSCCELATIVRDNAVDEVVLTDDSSCGPDAVDGLLAAYESGVEVRHASELFEEITGRIPVRSIGRHWLAVLPRHPGGGRAYDAARRVVDTTLSGIALVALLPFLLVVALAIRIDSPGPVIYRQVREGHRGRTFTILKFRTMCDAAERNGAVWATLYDSRRTRLGRILRPTRIDELPQLWNVLVGDMSLIGPRPERPALAADLERSIPFYRVRLLVPPGITGWAQVRFAYASSVEDSLEKVQHDLYYVKHRSALLDLVIALKTIGILLKAAGH